MTQATCSVVVVGSKNYRAMERIRGGRLIRVQMLKMIKVIMPHILSNIPPKGGCANKPLICSKIEKQKNILSEV